MMVPSATNKMRYHGLSQNHTNEQSGFKAENGYIPESKIIVSTHTQDDELTIYKSKQQKPKVIILLIQ
jgi:hypothetical protein